MRHVSSKRFRLETREYYVIVTMYSFDAVGGCYAKGLESVGKQPSLLGGSWAVISGVIIRVTIDIVLLGDL